MFAREIISFFGFRVYYTDETSNRMVKNIVSRDTIVLLYSDNKNICSAIVVILQGCESVIYRFLNTYIVKYVIILYLSMNFHL